MTSLDLSPASAQPVSYPDVVAAPAAAVSVATHELPVPRSVKSTIRVARSSGVTLASGVTRSFAEIGWLREQLVLQFPGAVVPRVPTRAVSTMVGVELVPANDSRAGKPDIDLGSVAADFGAWFELLLRDATLAQSAILAKFVANEPIGVVKALAATLNKAEQPVAGLTRTDQVRFLVFKLVRELRITSWAGAPITDADVERSLAEHKATAAHMQANAKLLLANATQAAERRLQLADAEAKLSRNSLQVLGAAERVHDEPAIAALQIAATRFSAVQAAAGEADRAHAQADQQKLVALRLWLGVAHGFADAVERLSLARDTAQFAQPLLAKSATGTPRAHALDALTQAQAARAKQISDALAAAGAALQRTRTELMAAAFEQ